MSTSHDLLKSLMKPVDVKKLIDRLSFDLEDLETAAMEQPRLRLRAGRLQSQMLLRKLELKRKVAAVVGKKSINIRHKHGNNYTATAIKNELGYDHDVKHAQQKLDEAEALESYASDLTECYKERSMALLNLTKLRSSEISSELRSVKGQAEVKALREKARKMRDRYEEEVYS